MATKRKKTRIAKSNNQLPEIFAFVVLVFVIVISFSVVALIVSTTPLN